MPKTIVVIKVTGRQEVNYLLGAEVFSFAIMSKSRVWAHYASYSTKILSTGQTD
jgi:hypothetical protein